MGLHPDDEEFTRDMQAAIASLEASIAEIRTAYRLTGEAAGMTSADKWAAYCTHALMVAACGELSTEVGELLDDTYMQCLAYNTETTND